MSHIPTTLPSSSATTAIAFFLRSANIGCGTTLFQMRNLAFYRRAPSQYQDIHSIRHDRTDSFFTTSSMSFHSTLCEKSLRCSMSYDAFLWYTVSRDPITLFVPSMLITRLMLQAR